MHHTEQNRPFTFVLMYRVKRLILDLDMMPAATFAEIDFRGDCCWGGEAAVVVAVSVAATCCCCCCCRCCCIASIAHCRDHFTTPPQSDSSSDSARARLTGSRGGYCFSLPAFVNKPSRKREREPVRGIFVARLTVRSGFYFEGLATDANSTHEEGRRVQSDAIFHGKVVETGVLLDRSSFSVYLLHKHSKDRRHTTLVFCLVVKLGSLG